MDWLIWLAWVALIWTAVSLVVGLATAALGWASRHYPWADRIWRRVFFP